MDIRIGRSAHTCQASGRNFVHGEEIHSVVRLLEGELVREDYASESWTTEASKDAFCYWSAKYYDPKVAEAEPAEVFSPLRQAFYEAVEDPERPAQARAYLAAQLLRRQKVFRRIKESDESDGEIRLILYADRIGNRLIEVRDPNFSYAELDAARNRLLERLQELEAPQPPADTGGEAPAVPEAVAMQETEVPDEAAGTSENEVEQPEQATGTSEQDHASTEEQSIPATDL